MHAIHLAVISTIAASTSAVAQYRYDDATGTCRDATGRIGWNVGVRGPCADFRGRDLANASFGGEDLRGARFDGATLTDASFFRADVRGASFDGAQLARAMFSGARLEGASLRGASLTSAKLVNAALASADLRDADLRNADLHRTVFAGADLRGAIFSSHKALLDGAKWRLARVDETTRLPFSVEERMAQRLVSVTAIATSP